MPQHDIESPSFTDPLPSTPGEAEAKSSPFVCSDSKLNSGSSSMSDREESYESYGQADDVDCETGYSSLRFIDGMEGNSNSLMTPPNSLPSSNFSRRNSFARRSLRITPSSTPKRLGGTAVASQLYRTSPLSSGRSSSHDQEEMYSDESLEDNVQDLSHKIIGKRSIDEVCHVNPNRMYDSDYLFKKVQMLTEQMGVFADNQVSIDDKYSRVKQENAVLRERIAMLEEHQREAQTRADDRLAEEQKRNKELIARIERERQLTIENYDIKKLTLEKEKISLVDEKQRLKVINERLLAEKSTLEDRISDLECATKQYQEDNCKLNDMSKKEREEHRLEREQNYQVVEELRFEVGRLHAVEESHKKTSPSIENVLSNTEFEAEIRLLREDKHNLNEQLEDLQAQLLTSHLEEGRTLVSAANNNSLAAEFEQMSTDEGAQIATENDKLRLTLADSQEANRDLRAYIDGILLNVVEHYPQLLEVKRK